MPCILRTITIVALAVGCLAVGGCCSSAKEKADRYKRERDDYRAKLIGSVERARRMDAELRALKARLEQEAGRQREAAELDQILRLLQFLLTL